MEGDQAELSRYDLRERVVFITGGARGIGADAASRLVDRGACVALVDRDPEVERRAAELGSQAAAFVADVTDPVALEATVAATAERFGGIDVTVAGAGIVGVASPIDSIDPADFERVVEVNLMGVWRTLRATLPHVVERRGYLLPIASIAAAIPAPLLTAYAVSKAGVEAFARGLRLELAHQGTRVGVAYFGLVDTDLVRDVLTQPGIDEALKLGPGPVGKAIPVGRAGEAIVRGIERRARNVCAPRWVPALLATRGLQGPLEIAIGRNPRFIEAYRAASKTASDPKRTAAG